MIDRIGACQSSREQGQFVPPYTMRRALSYSDPLRECYARARDVIFVDCVRVLKNFPKRSILQHDDFFSIRPDPRWEAIGQAIVDHINTNNASIVAGSSREQRRPGRISTGSFR
jgi:hypothetical protein